MTAVHDNAPVSQSEQAAERLRAAVTELGVDFEEPTPGLVVVSLPGERKLRTTCSLSLGQHGLSVNAFVARHPDEQPEAVYAWLLRRNVRGGPVAFAIDHLGDIYLTGLLPLAAISTAEVDRLLGAVLTLADGSFNTILELGFASSIRREWDWRTRRGESTANLAAFSSWLERGDSPAGPEH